MALLRKVLLGLGFTVALLTTGAIWLLSGAPWPAVPPARTAAPAGFDAADYPDFSAIGSTPAADVTRLNDYGQPFEAYALPDRGMAYFILMSADDERRVMVFDREGALAGDIAGPPSLFPLVPFFVTADFVHELTPTGFTQRQPMEPVGQLSAAELGDMIGQSSHYRSFLPEDLPEDYPDRQAGLTVHVMRHNGVWKRVTSNSPEFFDWKGAKFDDLDAAYGVARADPAGTAANAFGGRYRVELTHFDQREFLRGRGAPMGSPTGTGFPTRWLGTGYYTVFVDNAPALRFSIKDDEEFVSDIYASRLNVEGGAGLDWIAITHLDQTGNRQVIIVSRRKETDDSGDQAGSARRPSSSRAAARR